MSRSARGRVRFPPPQDMPAPAEPVPVIGPVVITVRIGGTERRFDFSDLPCPRLVRHLAGAVTQITGEDGSQRSWTSVRATVACVRRFVGFVAAAHARPHAVDLADLTADLLNSFERGLLDHYGPGSRTPELEMGRLVRMLRVLHLQHTVAFDLEMQARIRFAATAARATVRPLDSYPLPVFEAMQNAAMADVRAIVQRITEGERLAAAGRDPDHHGWNKLENLLWHVAHHGPLTTARLHAAGTSNNNIWRCSGGMRAVNSRLFLTKHDLIPFLVLLICQTGLEPDCAHDLRADCLTNPARGFVGLDYVKNRSRGRSHKTMRVADGGAIHFPGGLIRLAQRLTWRGRDLAGTDRLWVDVTDGAARASFQPPRNIARSYPGWLKRHGLDQLTDRDGGPVELDLRRLRKTYKSRHYRRTAGVLDDFAVGHTKQVAARHYADIDAHRDLHEQTVEAGLSDALTTALTPPVVLDAAGARLDDGPGPLEPEEVRVALSGDNDVWLASCRDFYASPFVLKPGTGCPVAAWGCLECPNAVFTTRHLPSLLSFRAFLEAQRDELSTAEWAARYQLAHHRITSGVLPRFAEAQLSIALAIAQTHEPGLGLPARLLEHIS